MSDIHILETDLDLKQNLNISTVCKQLDILHLVFNVYNDGLQADLANYNVRLKALKSDKVPLIQDTDYTLVNNVVTIIGDEQLTTTSGNTLVELQFINKTTGEKKATFNLNLKVIASVLEIDRTISTATYTLLQELENKLDQASDFFKNIDEAIDVNTALNTSITNATTSKSNLDGSISTANTTTTNLGALNTTANTTKIALNTSITNANTSKSALDTSKTNADASKVALDTSIDEANSFVSAHGDIIDLDARVTQNTTDLSDIPNQPYITEKAKNVDVNNALALKTGKAYTDAQLALKASLTYVDGKVSTALSGTPKGAYATLALLQSAHPTDDGNIYVVTANGHIYDWISGAWTDTGIQYQSTGIADGSVTSKMLSFMPLFANKVGKNLLNHEKTIDGYYISMVNGSPVQDANFCYTDYIDVSNYAGKQISISGAEFNQSAFYTSGKTFISGDANSTKPTVLSVPSNATYIRLSIGIASKSLVQLEGYNIVTSFEPFHYVMSDDIFLQDKTIGSQKLIDTFVKGKKIINLIDLTKLAKGFFVSSSNGSLSSNVGFYASDFIAITPNTNYFISDGIGQFAYYNSSKTFVSGYPKASPNGSYTFKSPSDAYYVRSSLDVAKLLTVKMVEGTDDPDIYNTIEVIYETIEAKNKVIVVDANGNGDFIKLVDGISEGVKTPHSKVYVREGVYDLISELGDTYLSGVDDINGKKGIELWNNIHVIFSSNSKVLCNYTGSNEKVKTYLSAFNQRTGYDGFTLENLTVECSNIRYCVHDEHNSDSAQYVNKYINCHMKLDNSGNTAIYTKQCIGGGLGKNGEIVVDGCIFKGVTVATTDPLVSYHNAVFGTDAKSNIVVKNSYFCDGTFVVGYIGDTTKMTTAMVTGCSFPTAPYVKQENVGYTTINMEILSFSNEIRV